MNNSTKRNIIITISSLLVIFIMSISFVKKASADSIQDATISTDNISNACTVTGSSANEATITTTLSRQAPVSIVNYSNEVTESSDTYDYSVKYSQETNNSLELTPIETTMAPYTDNSTINNNNTVNNSTTNNTYTTAPTVTSTQAPVTQNNTSNVAITKRIFIGDSRTVGMQQTIGSVNGVVWSCKSSMGLSWMKSTGVPNIENQITSGTAVIILMGVNDLHNTKNYISYINQKATEWAAKGAKTYYVSVNPINETSYKGFKNTKIEEFNNTMQTGLKNVNYIDTYNYLQTHECNYTTDGLHYKSTTSKKIYELVKEATQ